MKVAAGSLSRISPLGFVKGAAAAATGMIVWLMVGYSDD